jgi:hypothetical protein
LKCASRADGLAATGALLALLLATAPDAVAQSRASAAPAPPGWFLCAGGTPSQTVHQVRRLMALSDKALVEADVARVFAQREKEQRLSAANLAKARLSIDFLYVAGDGPARMYYYEASKTIPEADAMARVSVSGWLRGDGGQPRSLGSKGELQWIELASEPDDLELIPEPVPIPDPTAWLVPQGVLGHRASHVWVMQRATGTGLLLVYEVGPGGVKQRPTSARCKP